MPNPTLTVSPAGGCRRSRRKKTSLSLLATPKMRRRPTNPKLHETIDLVDDEDDDIPVPVQVKDGEASPGKCPELILIDEVEASDTSACATPLPYSKQSPSTSASATTATQNSDKDSEDIEIIGMKIVSHATEGTPLRANNTSANKATPANSRNKRRSSCSVTFSSVRQAVKRAKLRMSNSSNSLAMTAQSSRGISKKAKKRAKKVNRVLMMTNVRTPSNNVGISGRFLRSRARRYPVPVFQTLHELGPANPNFRHRPPSFFPVPSHSSHRNRFVNLAQEDALNPFMRAPGPPMFHPLHPIPVGPNNINVNPNLNQNEPGTKRPIVIDGSNVAMAHGNNQVFSCKGIKICAQFFLDRGHKDVTAFVPQFRTKSAESVDSYILDELHKQGILKYTPSREVDGRRISSYDDRFIVQCAVVNRGIIISNDNYRDLYKEEPEWRETIHNRILQFTWVNQEWLMFPRDPLGKQGPLLDQFLLF